MLVLLFPGDRVARMNMMLVELLFWAIAHYPQGTNVLIITRNENILGHPKISQIIHGLEERDFYFAIEHIDRFFSPVDTLRSLRSYVTTDSLL